MLKSRTLYFGDNLEILREKIPDESFDLIYLDPPFNSNRNYNVLFKEGLQDSPAQLQAFEDSWHWTREAQETFEELVGVRPSKTKINADIVNLMQAMEKLVGHNDMLAYLTMMTVRLIELRRVLKSTGSIYLHCDPTASHYLKIVLDTIFGKQNFRNEIVWKRTSSIKTSQFEDRKYGVSTDTILFYSKNDSYIFKSEDIKVPFSDEEILEHYPYQDEKGRYAKSPIFRSMSMGARPNLCYEYKGVRSPDEAGWKVSKSRLIEIDEAGDLGWSTKGNPFRKYRPEHTKGTLVSNLWDDIEMAGGHERLGYPTQKPEALLERIIKASSKEGDWILDPFCGCGTTVAVAERLNRNWVGIDITMLAINLIRHRLSKQYPDIEMFVDGRPKDVQAAQALFRKNPFEFEYWALDLVSAIPAQSKTKENMRGADKGIDGVINFIKDIENGRQIYGKLLVQVKGGGTHRNDIATLKGDVEREKADGGVFITLEEPTKPMKEEAVSAGSYEVKFAHQTYPKIQILTIEELLNNKKPELPLVALPYYKEAKEAQREKKDKKLL